MNYISTRGKIEPVSSTYAAANIYTADGGLYTPERMLKMDNDDFIHLAWLSHRRRTAYLFGKHMKEVYIGLVAKFGDKSFDPQDFGENIIRISERDGKYFMDMSHGPSGSVSDITLRPLPVVFEYCLTATGKGGHHIYGYDIEPDGRWEPLILIPSAGDEALAIIDSVKRLTNGKAAVLYPINGTSEANRRLLEEKQDEEDIIVRGMNADINEISHYITTYIKSKKSTGVDGLYPMRADGQSWFGIITQAACFISAYCEMLLKNYIEIGEWIDFSIAHEDTLEMATAAFYAKGWGLMADKIICPAPEGSVLHRLVTDGELVSDCVKDGTFKSVALERLLYGAAAFAGGADGFIANVLDGLAADDRFILPENVAGKLREAFCFGDRGRNKTIVI